MKVTFSNCPETKTEYNVKDVCDIIREFLHKNGISKETAKDFTCVLTANRVGFRFSCSNSEYTRSLALLMILLSEPASKIGGYMTHIKDVNTIDDITGCTMYLNIKAYEFETIYKWIKSNMSVKVEN